MAASETWWACVATADGKWEVHEAATWAPLFEDEWNDLDEGGGYDSVPKPLNDARKCGLRLIEGTREDAELAAQFMATAVIERRDVIEHLRVAWDEKRAREAEKARLKWEKESAKWKKEEQERKDYIGSPEWEAELAAMEPEKAQQKRNDDLLWKKDPYHYMYIQYMRYHFLQFLPSAKMSMMAAQVARERPNPPGLGLQAMIESQWSWYPRVTDTGAGVFVPFNGGDTMTAESKFASDAESP